ncbi:hypothetical protein C8Q75DRAFT_742665 [Abortiporus biennis]|nr:hypothetical protein C8Q75DRAFT_742665 [Abortiporus biennis]
MSTLVCTIDAAWIDRKHRMLQVYSPHNRYAALSGIQQIRFKETQDKRFNASFRDISQGMLSHLDCQNWLCNIQRVELYGHTPQFLQGCMIWLSRMPYLISLKLSVDATTSFQANHLALLGSLSNLQRLRLDVGISHLSNSEGEDFCRELASLLHRLTFLQRLELSANIYKLAMVNHFGAIPHHSQIQELYIFPHGPDVTITDTMTRGIGWLDPVLLSSFSSIRTFAIQMHIPIFYRQTDIATILMNWPHVQAVSLNPLPNTFPPDISLPSMACLITVAQCGPFLKHFEACLDCRTPPPPASLPKETWAPQVTSLNLGYSVGPNGDEQALLQVAQCLNQLFPGIKMLNKCNSPFVRNIQKNLDATRSPRS